MRIFLATLLLFCLMPTAHPQAQDVFVKQHQNKTKQAAPVIDLTPTKRELQTTKDEPLPEIKQGKKEEASLQDKTIVSKEMTEKYYNHCLAQDSDILSTESQEQLCACTSAKMSEEMSVEEIKIMFEDTAAGQKMRNFMLLSVYTPCMKYPARDLVYKTCAEDRAVSENLKKPRAVCDCMADKMSDYTVEKAPNVIAKAMRHDPGDLDPLALLFDDVHFNAHAKGVMTQCLYTQEYGWK